MNRAFSFFLIILSILMIIGCGNKRSPTGGPVDTEKPVLSATIPEQFGDISSRRIELTFSKALDKSSLTRGVYFYPPILDKKVHYASNAVTIEIREDLIPDTNYYITLTSAIKDTRGNPLDKNQTIVFRNGKFNDYRISGTFRLEQEADLDLPITIYLLSPDSLMILSRQFTSCAYVIDALNPAQHILRAFIDRNDNHRYDHGSEPYFEGQAPNQPFVTLDVHLAYADTTKPVIRSVQALNDRELQVNLSEPVKSWQEIKVLRLSDRSPLPIQIAYHEKDKIFLFTDPADSTRYVIELFGATDPKDNIQSLTSLQFSAGTKQDRTPPRIIATNPRNGTAVNDLRPIIEFHFSKLIPADRINFALIESDTKRNIPLETVQSNHKVYRFQPIHDLTNQKTYRLTISSDTADFHGNKLEQPFEMSFLPLIQQ